MQHIKDGTATIEDVVAVNTMYPELSDNLRLQMFDTLAGMDKKDDGISQRVVQGMSLFLDTPMGASYKAENITANQGIYLEGQTQVQPEHNDRIVSAAGGEGLPKLAAAAQTGTQSRALNKLRS